jgi:hypothetical protein
VPPDPFVKLNCPSQSAYLRLWGRSPAGWFGLVRWDEPTLDHRTGVGRRGTLFCTAWVPATMISPWGEHTDYGQIERVKLGADPQYWPTLMRNKQASHPDDFYLGLLDGSEIAPPPGIQWLGQAAAVGAKAADRPTSTRLPFTPPVRQPHRNRFGCGVLLGSRAPACGALVLRGDRHLPAVRRPPSCAPHLTAAKVVSQPSHRASLVTWRKVP